MSDDVRIRVVNAEALRLGPDEVLVLRLRTDDPKMLEAAATALKSVGLEDRALVVAGEQIELAVISSKPSSG